MLNDNPFWALNRDGLFLWHDFDITHWAAGTGIMFLTLNKSDKILEKMIQRSFFILQIDGGKYFSYNENKYI